MDFSLSQDQKQIQRLSMAMRQSLEILQMSSSELVELVKKECKKNPTIEASYFDRPNSRLSKEESDKHQQLLENQSAEVPLEQHLLEQVPDWPDEKKNILLQLLEHLDERGFFNDNLNVVANLLKIPEGAVAAVLEELKRLDPCGIGAKDLQECLILQLENFSDERASLAKTLVQNHFFDLQNGKIDSISKALGISREKIISVGKFITRLNFSPMKGYSNDRVIAIIADIKIFKSADGQWVVDFNDDQIPTIRFSKLYRKIICDDEDLKREDLGYLRKQARVGRRLQEAIIRRKETLLKIVKVIFQRQLNFFEKGAKFLKPLRLKDVADEIGLSVSTVSRAIDKKFVSTPFDIWKMSNFFDIEVNFSISRRSILEKIREIVECTPHKLTDSEISKILENCGIHIARRTVSKYRQMLNIPNSRKIVKL